MMIFKQCHAATDAELCERSEHLHSLPDTVCYLYAKNGLWKTALFLFFFQKKLFLNLHKGY
jgi:hypothetical protein